VQRYADKSAHADALSQRLCLRVQISLHGYLHRYCVRWATKRRLKTALSTAKGARSTVTARATSACCLAVLHRAHLLPPGHPGMPRQPLMAGGLQGSTVGYRLRQFSASIAYNCNCTVHCTQAPVSCQALFGIHTLQSRVAATAASVVETIAAGMHVQRSLTVDIFVVPERDVLRRR
jgi:hypothetical protein